MALLLSKRVTDVRQHDITISYHISVTVTPLTLKVWLAVLLFAVGQPPFASDFSVWRSKAACLKPLRWMWLQWKDVKRREQSAKYFGRSAGSGFVQFVLSTSEILECFSTWAFWVKKSLCCSHSEWLEPVKAFHNWHQFSSFLWGRNVYPSIHPWSTTMDTIAA